MTRARLLAACLLAATLRPELAISAPGPRRPVEYVDPRIDTHQSRWIYFASASRPFGMVSLSPDTRVDGDWGAGYIYGEPYIRAFSHMHDWQLAGIPVMPVVGRMTGAGGYEAYKAPFSHDTEVVRPGYTDLWHALLGRRTFSDADGRYVDNTGPRPTIRRVPLDASGRPTRATYNSDAFWGSHWNLNVLWSFAYPRTMSEQISSLVDYYVNGGQTARGPAGGRDSFVMIGDQATPLIAAAYNKGIRDFDVEAAYAGARKNAFPGGIRDRAGYEFGPDPQGGGMQEYVERGWIRVSPGTRGFHRAGAAQTLEYAYEDWCLSQFAAALGRADDAALFKRRSSNWKNLFDPSVGWIRPRNADGSWLEPFTPTCTGGACPGFVESNSAIYTYFVPHDLPGLVAAMGGRAAFIERLQRQFELAAPKRYVTPHGTHAEEWIDYENQPSCAMAHLFTYAGAPSLTQYWVRRVKEEAYGDTTPLGGYNGDEDQGQMGALGVLMAIGLFDVTGGAGIDPRYEITSPLFDRVTIALDSRYYPGRTFTIVTHGNVPGNVYIQAASLNGRSIVDRLWVSHRELTAGGTLDVTLGPRPRP